MYRKYIRWKMDALKCVSRHPWLCFILLVTVLLTLSYLNNRLNQCLLYRYTFQGHASSFQEQSRQQLKSSYRTKSVKECEIFSLQHNLDRVKLSKSQKSKCERISPVPGSCDLADEIFFSVPQATCSHQRSFNFCQLKRSIHGKYEVTCNETQSRVCTSPLSVGKINKHTGFLTWEESGTPQKTSELLTSYIQSSGHTDTARHYGFCFIRCLTKYPVSNNIYEDFYGSDNNFYDNDEQKMYAEQLLILPPQLEPLNSELKSSSKYNFNINILLVDSVSHQHFFRSLPKTVSALREIISLPGSGTTVLGFELVQAVRSRTYETLQTIFSGDVDPSEKPFGTQEIPPRPLRLSFLLKKFKDKGYHTLWIEDLCYLWEWGISKDLHFLNKSSSSKDTWVRMWEKLNDNFVDSVEVTLAMCKILEANDIADHFHGPDSVCFNGRHQHEYLLEYIQLYQQAMEFRKLPYFTFTMTNVAHEESGRRVQTLDKSLASYLKFTASLHNTLTIVFSDHGNAYGRFIHATQEARIELFHPFMIFIIPKNVARIIGNQSMQSLNINTLRLVSFLDLHHTLNYIIDSNSLNRSVKEHFRVSRKGLLESIDANRTCDDIPRIMPNLCICQNYDTPVANNTDLNLFAYFALGRLNDEIQRQLLLSQMKSSTLRSTSEMTAFKKCEQLVLVNVQNVRRSFGQNRTQTLKMDLHMQRSQVFFVAVSIKYNSQGQGHHRTELEMYDRITPYSKFSVCADDVDLSLCVCDITKTSADSDPEFYIPQVKDFANMNLLPNFETIIQNINDEEGCVSVMTVRHKNGAVIFSINSCKEKGIILTAVLEADDQMIYSSPPEATALLPGGIVVFGLVYTETGDSWTSSVRISYRVVSELNEFKLR